MLRNQVRKHPATIDSGPTAPRTCSKNDRAKHLRQAGRVSTRPDTQEMQRTLVPTRSPKLPALWPTRIPKGESATSSTHESPLQGLRAPAWPASSPSSQTRCVLGARSRQPLAASEQGQPAASQPARQQPASQPATNMMGGWLRGWLAAGRVPRCCLLLPEASAARRAVNRH